MKHPFVFKAEKSVETILYIVQSVEQATFHRISKVMYFADKIHLERYGRFICGDSYVAMKHGPVPSGTYDILKVTRGNHNNSFPLLPHINFSHQAFTVVEKFIVKPLRPASLDYLSESDLECLDKAIEIYGRLSFRQLTDLSHDQAWQAVDENDCLNIEQIVSTLTNAENLLDYLLEPYPSP